MKLIEHLSLSGRRKGAVLLSFLLFSLTSVFSQSGTRIPITGTVVDTAGVGVPNVTVTERGTTNSTATSQTGGFSLNVAGTGSVLVVSSVGYAPMDVTVGSQTALTIRLQQTSQALGEVVVVGYGTQKRGSVTGSIATVTSRDIDRVQGGSTVSTRLAGKLAGVTFRMPDGRPGAAANIQIRNMGRPLYVIDGIQQDENQFNNLSPNDIESISVLKDASAAIYGVRAANGVVVVTTKKGATGRNTINVDAFTGWQNWFRFPNVLNNSYDYYRYRAEAEVNSNGSTNITQSELDKYKAGTDPAYRSFDWRKFVMEKNAPQNTVNINLNGGSENVNYYVSGTHLNQTSVMGREYEFKRSNIQSNVTAKLSNRLRVGLDLNGRVETRENPGVPASMIIF
jgi:TonB-linked SusC/RagA family outer membrane protein